MENPENGEVDQLDLGHALVENVIDIIKKRVLKRRGFETSVEKESQKLKSIEEEVKDIKSMIQQIKQAVVKT